MATVINLIYLISLVFWIGGIFFFSFAAAPSIFKVLPRELAGDVVADIFPKYYLVSYICGFFLLSTILIKKYLFESTERYINLSIILVILMLGLSVYAGEVLRPQASEIKTEIRAVESGSAEYKKLDKRFKFIHLKSVISNLAVFIFGIAIILIYAYNYKVY